MDIAQLKIFCAVVETGGVTHAARKLHRVQSNVTTRIKQLEDDLGVELFVRDGKKLHLSPQGEILLDYARRILQLTDEAREAVYDKGPKGLLRLGASESAATVRLPVPLSRYHVLYPDVTIELHVGTTEALLNQLQDHELDVVLTSHPGEDVAFENVQIYEDEVVLVDRVSDVLPESKETGVSVLAFEKGCINRARLEEWLSYKDIRPERIIEMNSFHTIFSCIIAGMGVTVVPKTVFETFPDRDKLRIRTLPRQMNRIMTSLFWRKGVMSPKIAKLREVLETCIAEAG